MKHYILFLVAFFIYNLSIGQQNYYVSTTGNDSNDGSLANPWKSIQYGTFQLEAGDILNILEGTYFEKFYLENSGTENAMIIIKAYQNQNVILDANSYSDDLPIFYAGDQSYFRLEGLHFTNCYHESGAGGIFINGSGSNIEIINCKFDNIAISKDLNFEVTGDTNQPVISFAGDSPSDSLSNILVEGIEISNCRPGFSECLAIGGNATDFVFTRNHIHHNTNIAIDPGGNYKTCPTPKLDHARRGIISYNHCHHNISPYATAAGVYVDGGHDIIIENNDLHHNDYGVEIGCEETGTTENIICRNNLIYFNTNAGISLGGYDESTAGYVTNSSVLNNTFYKNDTYDYGNGEILFTQFENGVVQNNIFYISSQNYLMSNDLDQPNLDMNHNLVYCEAGRANIEAYWNEEDLIDLNDLYSTIGFGNDDTYGNPMFVDEENFDFHISETSPAINMGNPAYTSFGSELDIDDEERIYNGRIDCGADELNIPTIVICPVEIETTVFPNPCYDEIRLESPIAIDIITIRDKNGKVVFKSDLDTDQSHIDLSRLKSGVYFVTLDEEKGSQNQGIKLIKL